VIQAGYLKSTRRMICSSLMAGTPESLCGTWQGEKDWLVADDLLKS